jgi:hypothetical protein
MWAAWRARRSVACAAHPRAQFPLLRSVACAAHAARHTSKFSSKHLFPISRPAAYSSVASGGRDLGPISDMIGGAASGALSANSATRARRDLEQTRARGCDRIDFPGNCVAAALGTACSP